MDRWLTLLSLIFIIGSCALSYQKLLKNSKSRYAFFGLLTAFTILTFVVGIRGEAQGACPIKDKGEVMIFFSWSLMLVYLLMGSLYRVSLMGLFTLPFAGGLLLLAITPSIYEPMPAVRIEQADPWLEAHASLYMLGYGILLLSSIASLMFITLNKRLKSKNLQGFIFEQMAPINTLTNSSSRLIIFALILLTIAMVAGYQIETPATEIKNWIGRLSWLAYLGLILIKSFRGLSPKNFAIANIVIFGFSLLAIQFV